MKKAHLAWAILRASDNRLDGWRQWLEGVPNGTTRTVLFPTRAAARAYVKERHGYLRARSDLRAEPHGWKMPRVVRVEISIAVISVRSVASP